MFGINTKKIETSDVDLIYFDLDLKTENITTSPLPMSRELSDDNSLELKTVTKKIFLNESPDNKEKYIMDFLLSHIKFVDMYKLDTHLKKSSFKRTLNCYNNMIFVMGRIGTANSLIINTKIKDKKYAYLDSIKEFAEDNKITIYFTDYIQEDTILLLRNNNTENPGFVILENDKDNLFNIIGLGFFPEFQAKLIKLIF